MYLPKTPEIAKKIFPKLKWDEKTEEKTVYLTFDDGPTPGLTRWVLDQLREYDAKATFFCLGKNAELYPAIFEETLKEGHAVGNHTYNHLDSWKSNRKKYLQDIERCDQVFSSKYFRPPYGKLKPGIRTAIRKKYEIVMWDVMAYDFDQSISSEQCLNNVLDNVKTGSIIVFHDSIKAEKHIRYAL
ncbi:MAG: polysaccharide deacetylase family protein, partial [Chitinophagales bacterium]|nr:polysaccharide deacetylase family protein [Chitinophagales bacterium]